MDHDTNKSGQKQNWRWEIRLEDGNPIILELLADRSSGVGSRVEPLPTEGNISALNVPHSAMVIDLHDSTEITADLLKGNGSTTQTIRYANIVSFVCLKALALDGRVERKDPHDLVYCLEHAKGGIDAAAAAFRDQIGGKHAAVVRHCLDILKSHFLADEKTEGYKKDGPAMVANFELGESGDRDRTILRQREVSDLVELFLRLVAAVPAVPAAEPEVLTPESAQ